MPTPTVNDLYEIFYGKSVDSVTPPEYEGGFAVVHFSDGTQQFSAFYVSERA